MFIGDDIGLSGAFPDEPPEWQATDLTLVQLVGCVDVTNGPVASTCDYTPSGAAQPVRQTIYWGDFTITLHQAATGAQVGSPVHIRGSDASCEVLQVIIGNKIPNAHSAFTAAQIQQTLGRYIR